MTADVKTRRDDSATAEHDYREVSWPSVISLLMAVLALLSLPFMIGANPTLSGAILYAIAPGFGFVCGVRGLVQTGRYPQDFTGRPLAWAGTVMTALLVVCGWGAMSYVYQTEVPEGFQRLSYAELQSKRGLVEVPESAMKFNEQQVFVKGYMYPGQFEHGIRQFILCRDNGQCCFGGKPKINDMIYVRMKDTESISYATHIRKLTGKFRVQPGQALHELGTVFYYLDDAECRQ